MMNRKVLLSLWVAMLTSFALAQTVSVQIMTDAPVPADFGTLYSLGQLNNASYTYGPNFIIQVSYSDASNHSLSLALSGSQANYELAWREAGTALDNAFANSLGAGVVGLSGSGSGLFYRSDGTLQSLSVSGTRYQMGARATPSASADLSTPITLTATLF
jgi:hypothetical protein